MLAGVDVVALHGAAESVEISAVVHETGRVVDGSLFCCVPGARVDGHDLAGEAARSGARALLVERYVDVDIPVVQIEVADVRSAMGPVAAAFWGHPSRSLDVVGVTGTNGKTTTTLLLQAILESAGRPTGIIGTLSGVRTTPEAPELQARLAGFRDDAMVAVAVEVSSHALVQHRVDATRFRVAIFTNLGRDHLDYHETEEAYFQAKARLFQPDLADRAVVNVDDLHGRLLAQAARIPTTTWSLADAADIDLALGRSRFNWRGHLVELPLGGRHNVSNALGAATAALELGLDEEQIARGLASVPLVVGRFEVVAREPVAVVVDYAHSPEALEQLLRATREIAPAGKVIVVFGAGGDRDQGKRPAMGEVAGRLADHVVLTSDNPRHEDPAAIAADVRRGLVGPTPVVVELDRRAAIAIGLELARPGDVVVVAGKGHETTQVIGAEEREFDDRVVVREELARLGKAPSA